MRPTGTLTIIDSDIEHNSATNGGAIANDGGTVSLIEKFEYGVNNNTATGVGGGIWNGNDGTVTLSSFNVIRNTATQGGGIYNGGGTVTLSTAPGTCPMCMQVGGNSAQDGGAFFNAAGNLNLIGPFFLNQNHASNDGGVIYNNDNVAITDANFFDNHASNGGIIFNNDQLDVSDSDLNGNTAGSSGGAIFNNGQVDISDSDVSGNTAGSSGGGIMNNEGNVSISASQLRSNGAGLHGGALSSAGVGTVTIETTTISGNIAAGSGGGVHVANSDLTIVDSLFRSNSAARGGGLFNAGNASVSQSTFSGNFASDKGGGIENYTATLTLGQSTITSNSATGGAGGVELWNGTPAGPATIGSTIISNNGVDVQGPNHLTSAGHNLVGSGDATGAFNQFTAPGDRVGVLDPMLWALADNGGRTLTHAPMPGSPVINAGDPAVSGGSDQTGAPRVRGGVVDIGAFEANPPVVRTLGVIPEGPSTQMAYDLRVQEVFFYEFLLFNDVTQANGHSLVIDTLGSLLGSGSLGDNDTEIGLYDATGMLVAENDDIDVSTNRLSRLTFGVGAAAGNEDLPAGTYYLAVGAYDTDFGVGFDATSSSNLAGSVVANFDLTRIPSVTCDFNGDTVCNGTDIDLLQANIVTGPADPGTFDLTGDGLVTVADRDEWLALAGAENLSSGNPYRLGDANLDGSVDGSDFGAWNGNKFTSNSAWTAGDFNADGSIDGSDFGLWNGNKFTSSDGGSLIASHLPANAAGRHDRVHDRLLAERKDRDDEPQNTHGAATQCILPSTRCSPPMPSMGELPERNDPVHAARRPSRPAGSIAGRFSFDDIRRPRSRGRIAKIPSHTVSNSQDPRSGCRCTPQLTITVPISFSCISVTANRTVATIQRRSLLHPRRCTP